MATGSQVATDAFDSLLRAAKQALDVFIRCDCELPHEGEQATDAEWNAVVDALRAVIAEVEQEEVAGEFCDCNLYPDEEEDASGRCKCCGKAIAEGQ